MFDILLRIGFRSFQRWNRSFVEKHIYLPAGFLTAGLVCLAVFAYSQNETMEVLGWGLVVLGYPWLLLIGGLGLCLKASQSAHDKDPVLPFSVGVKQLTALVPILAFLAYLGNQTTLSPPMVLAGLPLLFFALGLVLIALGGIISALINGSRKSEPEPEVVDFDRSSLHWDP